MCIFFAAATAASQPKMMIFVQKNCRFFFRDYNKDKIYIFLYYEHYFIIRIVMLYIYKNILNMIFAYGYENAFMLS